MTPLSPCKDFLQGDSVMAENHRVKIFTDNYDRLICKSGVQPADKVYLLRKP
jgi:hypothetical protein